MHGLLKWFINMGAAITTKTIGGRKPKEITTKDPAQAKLKLLEIDKLVGPSGDTRRLLNEALALL